VPPLRGRRCIAIARAGEKSGQPFPLTGEPRCGPLFPQSCFGPANRASGGNDLVDPAVGRVASQSERAIVGIVCAFRRTRPPNTYDKDTNMPSGTVKWFNAQKGYGFIQPSDGGKDVFVHISAVEQAGLSTLNEGQKITFDIITTDRGRTAAGNLKAG
jgi:CspA family cold shock protein